MSPEDDRKKQKKKPKSARVLDLAADAGAKAWHDPDGEPYLDVRSDAGVRRTLRVRSRACRTWLSGLLYETEGTALGGQAATDAVDLLHAMAVHDGPEREVFVRTGHHEGVTYLDLGGPMWRAARVSPTGWELVREPPVRFRRPQGLRALPAPVQGGGGWEALRELLHVENRRDWVLIVSWLVGTLHPSGPYPILALHGEHGSAKSTTGRILRSFVDPSEAPLRSPPRSDRDVVIAARNSHIIGLDNLSYIKDWLSDALCRIATGGGYSARELYTDGEEVVYSATRPILLTSIEGVATRGDLSDRTITVTLPRMREEERRAERDLWADIEELRPIVLGELLTAAATGLRRLPDVSLDSLPRMADFARWVVACQPALPWDEGTFMEAYRQQREEAVETGIEADPVAVALRELFHDEGLWKGTATDLLATLDRRRDGGPPPPKWPETPQALGGRLTRAAPLLREDGIEVCKYRDTSSSRTRVQHLHSSEKRCPGCPPPSTRPNPSEGRPAENPGDTGDSDNPDNPDKEMQSRATSDNTCPECGRRVGPNADLCATCKMQGVTP